ncbi:MAG: ketoacyl-ACP synthase III [Agarilytica sp.]
MSGFIKISGIGAYLPEQKVLSDDLMMEANSKNFGVAPEFLRRFSGIEERRFSREDERPSTMAIEASRAAIVDAGIDVKDIDQVIFCGIDKDFAEPATAHFVARELGIKEEADCFDVSNACHGIMSGFSVANGAIGIGAAENILLCTGENPSTVAMDVIRQLKGCRDRGQFRTLMGAMTLGDSGGAFVVSKARPDEGCKIMRFTSRSRCADYCYYRHTEHGVDFSMRMSEISTEAVQMHRDIIGSTYDKIEWEPDSISYVYCHQAGAKPHIKMAQLARQPINKAPITFKKFGNLTSSTIAVNMHLNRPNRGDRILMLGVGSGLSISQTACVY